MLKYKIRTSLGREDVIRKIADLLVEDNKLAGSVSDDGFKIRRTSVERSIPCLTSLDTAKALLASIEQKAEGELGIIDISTL